MIKTLIEDKCLTLFTLNEMIKLMFKNVLQDTFGLNSETVFKIDKEMLIQKILTICKSKLTQRRN